MPVKPSDKEEEHFKKLEFERKLRAERERAERLAREERERLQKLHHMKCPKCGMDLHHLDYMGVEVDRCGNCEGTFFDKGEVEKILHQPGMFDKLKGIFGISKE